MNNDSLLDRINDQREVWSGLGGMTMGHLGCAGIMGGGGETINIIYHLLKRRN